MEFSLDKFYQMNRRILIWAALFAVLWLSRDFFALIFLVFVLSFIAAPLVEFLHKRLHLRRWLSISAVYLFFLIALISFVRFVAPQVTREAHLLLSNIGQLETKLVEQKNKLVANYPSLDPLIKDYIRDSLTREQEEKDEQGRLRVRTLAPPQDLSDESLIHEYVSHQLRLLKNTFPRLVATLSKGLVTLALALLFSLLISLDMDRLRRELTGLKDSRLHDFYEQTAQPVVRFGYVVGRGLQAQAMIACLNTVLTLIGLVILGVPNLTMLSLVVFLCSFIPVLGVFISTTPIVLVALNSAGLALALGVIGLIILIHTIEAYILNPLIYGRHLKLNPVFVLMILFVGHHAFGLWGMLLGVPVAHYLLHDVVGMRASTGILATEEDKARAVDG